MKLMQLTNCWPATNYVTVVFEL